MGWIGRDHGKAGQHQDDDTAGDHSFWTAARIDAATKIGANNARQIGQNTKNTDLNDRPLKHTDSIYAAKCV